MAKKKDVECEIQLEDFVERIRAEVNKEYGKGICITGQEILDRKIQIIPWCLSLDSILSGVPEGCWISLSGPPKTGKTTSALQLAANAQKMGKTIYFLGPEGRLKPMNLKGIKGLDLSPNKFVPFVSTPEKILSTQDYLNIAEKILKTHHGCFVLIDSISALADEKELEGGIGTMTRGHNNVVISQFVNNLAQLVPATKSIVVGIVQLYANTGGGMVKSVEKAASRFIYQSDIQLRLKYFDKWRVGNAESGEVIGQILHWECKTSALTNPFRTVDSYLRFGIGIDNVYEIFKFAESCGLIKRSGAWYELVFLEQHTDLLATPETKIPQLQGAEGVWNYLNENPKILECLTNEVKLSSEIPVSVESTEE